MPTEILKLPFSAFGRKNIPAAGNTFSVNAAGAPRYLNRHCQNIKPRITYKREIIDG